ncbi:hypothetical protein PR001_g32001 [Phytophthora rubi]|uniref:RxLR effector protein n=1 Tax=Phytophthora rubi TaxID=129364 RepID=A0A6A3GAN0_9STRA|nr:hypothetical protein PR001_g32001 [Phytophthora rubi]
MVIMIGLGAVEIIIFCPVDASPSRCHQSSFFGRRSSPPRTHGSISAAVVPKQLDSRLSDHLRRPLLRTRSA